MVSTQNNHHWDNITAKMSALRGKVGELERAAAQRKAKLDENSAFLQFNWKADVVESWIGTNLLLLLTLSGRVGSGVSQSDLSPVSVLAGWPGRFCCRPVEGAVCAVSSGEKENSLKTDDYGRDLSSVQTLLTKQVLPPSAPSKTSGTAAAPHAKFCCPLCVCVCV